jgi:5'(3')-deoxyribonucleotidase
VERIRDIVQKPGTERVVVALDNDGTLADVLPIIIRVANERKGTHYKVEDYRNFHPIGSAIGLTEQEFHEIYVDVWTNHRHEILPLADSRRLEQLANATDLYLLTGMDENLVPEFKKWLKSNFPEIADKVNICTTKTMIAKLGWGFDVLIDDAFDVDKRDLGHRLHLMPSQPYNMDVEIGPKTIRVSSTREAIDAVLRHIRRSEEKEAPR